MNQTPDPVLAARNDCWNRIGVVGDGSCAELPQVIHCRNCPVYADAGRGFLERGTWAEYREEWTSLLAEPKVERSAASQSWVIFTLEGEHLALPTVCFREVIELRRIHRVPARRSGVLLGLVNVRGELQLCVSLAALLGLSPKNEPRPAVQTSGRMLVVEHDGAVWVFPVDRVSGILRFEPAKLGAVPATLEKAHVRFSHGAIEWEGSSVGCLDEAVVFAAVGKGLV